MIVIVTVLFGMFCAAMEALITATILPTIISNLGGMELYPWLINSFLLSFIVVTPIFGKMSDTYGYKRVYLTAVTIFCLSSMLCGAAQSMEQLILFRGLQGIGTGGLITMSIIFFGEIFPLERRPRMQAMLSSMWAIASLLGPLIGAYLAHTLSWRWAFYINVPSAMAIFFLIYCFANGKRSKETTQPLDKIGLGVFIVSCGGFVYAIMGLSQLKTSIHTLLLLMASLCLGIIFIRHISNISNPFIPINLFKRQEVVLSVLLGFFCGFFLFCIANFLPMYVQGVLGMEANYVGRVVTAIAMGSFTGAIICGLLLNRKGFRTLAVGGAVSILAGFFSLILMDRQATLWKLSLSNFFIGLGISSIANASIIAAQAASPKAMLGRATSLFHFFRSFGGLIGIATMGGLQLGIFRRGLQSLIETNHQKYQYLFDFAQHPQQIFDSLRRALWNQEQLDVLPGLLGNSIHVVFICCFLAGIVAFYFSLKMPKKKPRDYSIAEDPIPLEE